MILQRLNDRSTLRRLNADGSLDPSFPNDPSFASIHRIELLPDDEILALILNLNRYVASSAQFVRIDQEGGVTRLLANTANFFSVPELMTLPDGRFFMDGQRYLPDGEKDASFTPGTGVVGVPLCRWKDGWLFKKSDAGPIVALRADGSLDKSFDNTQVSDSSIGACSGPGPSVYIYETLFTSRQPPLTRHYADGRKDPSFHPPDLRFNQVGVPDGMPIIGGSSFPTPTGIGSALVHPLTGELWIAGIFTHADDAIHTGLTRLETSIPDNYAEWSKAALRGRVEIDQRDDPDRDGIDNFHEYAAGVDPLVAGSAAAQSRILGDTVTLSAPRNPFANDITARLEVSSNLQDWRIATESDAEHTLAPGSHRFFLDRATQALYWRVRYLTQ